LKIKLKRPKFRLLRKMFSPVRKVFTTLDNVISLVRERVAKSVRMQLMATFIVCLLSAMVVASVTDSYLSKLNRDPVVDYSNGAESIDYYARNIVQDLTDYIQARYDDKHEIIWEEEYGRIELDEYIKDVLNRWNGKTKALIVDMDGNVLYRSENATENQVDLHNTIRNAMNTRIDSYRLHERAEFSSFYPITINDIRAYVIVSGMPEASITYHEGGGGGFVPVILGVATFILLFYFATQQKMKYIEELASGLLEISKGNLDHRIVGKSDDELGSLANNINFMAEELKNKIEEERRAEVLKNELITNVSHDLRTPLTSIMGYLNLLKDRKYETVDEAKQYLDIAYGKSEKLKVLIEDLFEYTKVTNQGIKLSLEKVYLNELIDQLTEELVPILEEKQLVFKKEFSKEKAIVFADTDKMVRIFENLLTNAIRYSKEQAEILIKTTVGEKHITVCIENKGEPISREDLDRIFDRFFKVEKSRTSNSAGSGLGLAISKNLITLHGGRIWADCKGDTIQFFVELNKFS